MTYLNACNSMLKKSWGISDPVSLKQPFQWFTYHVKIAFSMALVAFEAAPSKDFVTFETASSTAFVSYENSLFNGFQIILSKDFQCRQKLHPWKTWKTQISNGFNNPYTRELESIGSKQTIIHSKLIKLI